MYFIFLNDLQNLYRLLLKANTKTRFYRDDCSSSYLIIMSVSFGTDYTGQLSLSVIGRAENTIAGGLNMAEKCSMFIFYSSRDALWVFVNTGECSAIAKEVLCHQVSHILQCPGEGALSLGWDHQHGYPSGHIANSTRNIVVVKVVKWLSS